MTTTAAQFAGAALVIKRCADVLDASPEDADGLLAARAKAWLVRSGKASQEPSISVEEARELVKSLEA